MYVTKTSMIMREGENRHWEIAGNLYLTHLELFWEVNEVMYPKSFQGT